ncbi:type II toxin-antitoxin system SpoIISA family toxin [Rossellomorea marisflavi]|uniref:type II toxin-antitoxin system SpoIISA family toxin n=1 Tax=Rossellomorea marisflavi TaxID=189381 RepID=UPI003F9F7E1C
MEPSWYMIVIFSVILLGILVSVGLYIWNKKFYLKNMVAIRKGYYSLIVVASFILWISGAFPSVGEKFQHLIALVISIVVIDIFIFQTPEVTKFLSNELKPDSLVETITKNRDTFIDLSDKLIAVNEIMPKSQQKWHVEIGEEKGEFNFSLEKFDNFVLSYLNNFGSRFKMEIYSYTVISTENENEFIESIENAYDEIVEEHDFTHRDLGMRKKRAISTLSEGKNIEVFSGENSAVIFPYFGEYYNFIYVIRSRAGKDVTGADASLLLNMLYTFDLWLLSEEDEFTGQESEEDWEDGWIEEDI